nr:reverse transcriptase domain-containing protein [Tanacetum cinerariifolium]
MGESSHDSTLEQHGKQIEEILNHLDELPSDRIERIEDVVEGLGEFDELKIKPKKARSQLSVLQKKQLTPRNEIAFTYFIISNLKNIIEETRACHQMNQEDLHNAIHKLKINMDEALSWWNAYAQPIRIEQANKIAWTELKRLITNKYCPRTELKKMEDEFYNLVIKENDLKTYIRRFQELALLCLNMVPNFEKLIEVFIGGLPRSIEGNDTASKLQTLKEVITITQRIKGKKPSELILSIQLRTVGMLETFLCLEDVDYIIQDLAVLCVKFATKWATRPSTAKTKATRNNLQPVSITCNVCGEKGHYVNQCSKANNKAKGKHT